MLPSCSHAAVTLLEHTITSGAQGGTDWLQAAASVQRECPGLCSPYVRRQSFGKEVSTYLDISDGLLLQQEGISFGLPVACVAVVILKGFVSHLQVQIPTGLHITHAHDR